MENEITNQKDNVLRAYSQATVEQKVLLENILGKDMFRPNVKERVKTFEDACSELGETNELVQAYRTATFDISGNPNDISDVVAYLKLRIISAALNEGWKPMFTVDEKRWYPWFRFWTEEELEYKSDKWKADNKRRMFGGRSCLGPACGLACSSSSTAWPRSYAVFSARLAVKSEALAEYFGEQFIDIWADYLFR